MILKVYQRNFIKFEDKMLFIKKNWREILEVQRKSQKREWKIKIEMNEEESCKKKILRKKRENEICFI